MNALKQTPNQPSLRGTLQHDAALARYTSWRVGGNADVLFVPEDLADLQAFMQQQAQDKPIYFIGLGSNLLIRDGGVRGAVVIMHKVLKHLAMDGDAVLVEAGVTCGKLAKFCAQNSKKGAAFFAGIPGTIGGALAMNAGCYGTETWDVIKAVTTINRKGDLTVREAQEFAPSYRHIAKPVEDEWFINAWIELPAGEPAEEQQAIKALLAKRLASQPLNQMSAGSTFRNPEGDYAARLIEAAGLKGHMIGGAQVSEKHANFIVNIDQATAMDIESLIKHMQTTVEAQFGVKLMQEVKMIGEYAG